MSIRGYKSAVVTGGASGIGRSCAEAFAREGCDVVIADLHEARLAETKASIEALGRRCIAVRCDVSSDSEMAELAARTIEFCGVPDIVMLNAGVAVLGPTDRIPIDQWRWNMEINFFGVLRGVLAFSEAMRERGSGHIVITSSVAGLYAYSFDAAPYVSSKHAAYGLAESLVLYLRPQGVDVSVLCPGLVVTNLGETARRAGVRPDQQYSHFPDYMMTDPMTPDQVATSVIDAVRDRTFLIYSHPCVSSRGLQRGRPTPSEPSTSRLPPCPTPLHRRGNDYGLLARSDVRGQLAAARYRARRPKSSALPVSRWPITSPCRAGSLRCIRRAKTRSTIARTSRSAHHRSPRWPR